MHLKNTRKEEKNHEYADYYAVCGYGDLLHNPYACFFFSMLAASITYFLLAAPDKLGQVFTVITGNMFANYTMLAAPLFIFMANVLNEGEVTDKLFSFCNGLLGRLKGGTAQVNVFISLIFSGMTGSAIADASGIGLMEIDQMKK